MRLSHESPAGTTRTVASTVEVADTFFQKAVGLMGKTSVPDDYALVFPFDQTKSRTIHTFGVRTPIDVLWISDNTVVDRQTLRPWIGISRADADTIIELQAGAAANIAVGDRVYVTED